MIQQCKYRLYKSGYTVITVTANITSVDFRNLTVKTEFYQLFRKPNNDSIYIDINSNHPPQILRQLPKSIRKRLFENSSSKEVFIKSKALYEKCLDNSGFNENLIYHQDNRSKINIKISNNAKTK